MKLKKDWNPQALIGEKCRFKFKDKWKYPFPGDYFCRGMIVSWLPLTKKFVIICGDGRLREVAVSKLEIAKQDKCKHCGSMYDDYFAIR